MDDNKFTIPPSAAEQPKREIKNIPLILIDNPFFGKPFITAFEALDAINYLSEKLRDHERSKPIDNGSA